MTKNRTAKFNIEQIGIDEDVLFNLMTHDAKYDFYALRPDEVTELQNSIKAIIDDRDRLRAQANIFGELLRRVKGRILNERDRLKQANAAQLEALQIIAGNGCEYYHTQVQYGACIHARPKGRNAGYSADAWCDQCVAWDSINQLENDKTEPG